jgi:DNA-binding transcriptional LysR family regulator
MGNKKPSQNWDDLRYFLAVARTGTLSAAARQLGTEHTTVARHIQALEDELNNRLFHKSNSGYGLTDAGERLLAGAEAIESPYVSAKAAASSEGQPIIGTVRIGAPDGFGSVFLAPRVQALTDRHPQLEIEIIPSARLFSLLKREADIAIGQSRGHATVASPGGRSAATAVRLSGFPRQIGPSPAAPHPPAPRVPPSPRSRGEGWGEGHRRRDALVSATLPRTDAPLHNRHRGTGQP